MEANTYVGLDIHRKSIVATALDARGETVGEAKIGPTTTELTAFLRGLPGTKHVVMEPCTIWEPLYESLEEEGIETLLTNPLRTRLIADATIKTDRVDSQALATLLRLQAIPQIFVPDAETRSALRHLVRERYFYRRKATSVLNRAYAQLIHQRDRVSGPRSAHGGGPQAHPDPGTPRRQPVRSTPSSTFGRRRRNSTEGPRRLSAHARRTMAEDHPWGRRARRRHSGGVPLPIERFPTIDRLYRRMWDSPPPPISPESSATRAS